MPYSALGVDGKWTQREIDHPLTGWMVSNVGMLFILKYVEGMFKPPALIEFEFEQLTGVLSYETCVLEAESR